MPNFNPTRHDLSGQRFGRWTAVRAVPGKQKWSIMWECRCDCGTVKPVNPKSLKNGESRSCGCYRRTFSAQKATTHGKFGTPTYRTWAGMWTRCTNQNERCYPRYGGRGISVCDRWKSFENFYADMGEKPKGLTLDRIDSNGDYEPSNCRWASIRTQANNTRRNHRIAFDGKTLTAAQWSRVTGIGAGTILHRIRSGWSPRRALTDPPVMGKNQYSPRSSLRNPSI